MGTSNANRTTGRVMDLRGLPRHERGARAGTLRIERRRGAREEASGGLMASYTNGERVGVTRLELVDRSVGGMGVVSRVKIEPGMLVTLCADGAKIPWLTGRAVRCEAIGEDEYRVGIAFSTKMAA